MLNVEDWAEIRRLHFAEGLGIKTIARELGIARNTVRAALRSTEPPRYGRPPRPSVVDPFEPEIRRLLKAHPRMPATVIAERVGWERGMTVFRERVAALRLLYLPPDPYQRTEYLPGQLAQWDVWFPPAAVPLGFGHEGSPPVLVGVAGYSRVTVARMVPSREAHDLLWGHLQCLVDLGAVPKEGVYDQESAIGALRGGVPRFTDAFQAFRGTLGMGAILVRTPEAKGLVERSIGYLETSFLPGRSFSDPWDFNAQLADWLTRANRRIHRELRCRPTDRLPEDLGSMIPLPPVLPDPALRTSVRLPRDHYVRAATCDYSVDPRVIGRRIEVRVDPEWVVATCEGREMARHRRSWAPHRTLTDPAHARARRQLREGRAERPAPSADVEVRDLAVYDRALGVA